MSVQDISPLRDEVGRVIGNPPPDEWEGRVGVATALKQIAAHFSKSDCMSVLDFMVPQGLGDRHSEVRSALLNAALLLLDIHGKVSMCLWSHESHMTSLHFHLTW